MRHFSSPRSLITVLYYFPPKSHLILRASMYSRNDRCKWHLAFNIQRLGMKQQIANGDSLTPKISSGAGVLVWLMDEMKNNSKNKNAVNQLVPALYIYIYIHTYGVGSFLLHACSYFVTKKKDKEEVDRERLTELVRRTSAADISDARLRRKVS